jgi:uroporphyrinogen decarboxylase
MLKQDQMTLDERLIAILNRKPIDRIPLWGMIGGFSAINTGFTINDRYQDETGATHIAMFDRTREQYGFQDLPAMGYTGFGSLEFGGEVKYPTSQYAQSMMVVRHPVATEEDAWNLEIPDDIGQLGMIPRMMAQSKLEISRGASYTRLLSTGCWEVARSFCGIEQLCRWALKKPEVAHRVLQLATDFLLKVAEYWVSQIGAERLMVSSPNPTTSNQIISPRIFEQLALPYIKQLHQNVLALGVKHIYCHICGEHNDNYPYWAQIPMGDPGIISVSHEVDLDVASKCFPKDIIIGNIEPVTIQSGTPEQIYEQSRICIEKGRKHPGGFMLAPGCELPPRAPAHNVWMITKALNDFGWYD